MQIIDCDALFGFAASGGPDVSLQALLRTEKAQSVSYAMASSVKARAYDAREGNDDTLRAARENEALLPVASVDPRSGYRFEDEVARVAELGFVALRVYPELQGWSLDSAHFQRMTKACSQYGLPLMVSIKAAGTATQVTRAAGDTGTPVILLGSTYATLGETLSAAAARPNTLVSTSQFITPGVVEIAAEMIGVDNLVYGATAPDLCVRPPINMILSCDLTQANKERILAGNISRVISGQLAKLNRTLSASSDEASYNSRRLPGPIIDVHGHLGPWPFPMRNPDAQCIREMMGKWGISKTLLSSTKAIVNDFVEGNAELAEAVAGSDDLYGYVTINPNYPEQSLQEVEKYLGLPNFIAVKFHPAYARVSIDAPVTRKLIASFADRKPPMLIHTWGPGEVEKMAKLAAEFPQMSFLMGHGGASGWLEAIDVLKKTPNLYTEFCNSWVEPGKIRATIDAVGADKVMFGTDAGLFDPAFCAGIYEEADLTAAEQDAILRDNASRVFRI